MASKASIINCRTALGAVALLRAVSACSGEGGGADTEVSMFPNGPGQPSAGASGSGSGLMGGGVANYDRPPGMPIGRGAPSGGEAPDVVREPVGAGGTGASPTDVDDLTIPEFEEPEEDPPPCSGCVELNAYVNDINQRDEFVFSAGNVAVTRVVWTIIVPFNSDQLFVHPFVDGVYGTYTDLDANAFPVDTPVELVHVYSGNANQVGLGIGSAGAWTGDMTMSLFVDSVRLEGANGAASRTFDAGVDGFAPRSNARSPRVVFHP